MGVDMGEVVAAQDIWLSWRRGRYSSIVELLQRKALYP